MTTCYVTDHKKISKKLNKSKPEWKIKANQYFSVSQV